MANQSGSSAAAAPHPVVNLATLKTACSGCNLRELCMPVGLSLEQLESLDELVYARKAVRRGESLFRAGDTFRFLYAIRSGFFKTRITGSDGLDQVAGFHMTGEMLGIDGIGADRHACDAVALEDSELCVIPYAALGDLCRHLEPLHRHFHKVMAREIVRDHGAMLMLGSMSAREKLAVFLLDLSKRFAARGFSSSEFMLRMTRGEIASFLGLKLETVSRLFSRFRDDGLIEIRQKRVRIRSIPDLRELTGGCR